jgi:hypothetical protein
MTNKEFNLSEKRETDFASDFYYWQQDVKEFIRLETSLLSDLLEKKISWAEFDEKRANLIGDKLK